MVEVLVTAAVLVAIAELGDKTQMLTLLLASRYPARSVFLGVLAAVVALQLLATAAGRIVGGVLPDRVLAIATGAFFIGFGVLTIRSARSADADSDAPVAPGSWGPVVAVAAAFFLAELGDKTQVLTLAVAADPGAAVRVLGPSGAGSSADIGGAGAFLGVWIGSTLGMMVVNSVAIVAGGIIGRHLPRVLVARVSGVLFIMFGVLVLGATWLT